jgi:type II secretory pathway predicted ATPase ExeA
MQADHSSLGSQAFGEGADRLITVKYRSHQDALSFLLSSLRQPNGIGLLHGPEGSGKTTTVRELALQLARDADVAFIDGTHCKPRGLLTNIMAQFGIDNSAEPDDELLRMVNDFAMQQTRSWQSPVLMIDNVDKMYPSTLRILNAMAGLEVQGLFALRFVFTGHKGLHALIDSNGMTSVAQRGPGKFSMSPLSAKETMIYLHARLQAAGSERADTIFPFDVCDRLREQSEGWPGRLNQFALDAIKRSSGFPISLVNTYAPGDARETRVEMAPTPQLETEAQRQPPRIIVSRDGTTVDSYTFQDVKILVGRSDFADIVIDDDFVSKLHAMLLLYSDALVLLDLNSANGTTVNSVKLRKTILKDHDVISLGHHRLKVENAPEISAEMQELLKSPDTLKMKNLIDIRRLRAQRRMKSAK